jgi:hypothetical protein
VEVTLYRKEGCGLCDQAEQMLARIARGLPFTLIRVDIDSDPQLQRRYFLEIPVVEVAGSVIAQAPIDERGLEAELRERSSRGHA